MRPSVAQSIETLLQTSERDDRGTVAVDVLTVDETAELLRVGRNHVYGLVAKNEIPHARVGRFIRFRRAAVMQWLHSCGPQVAQGRH